MEFPEEMTVHGHVEISGIESNLSDIASICSGFDDFVFVAVCLACAAMGWKKAMNALLLFLFVEISRTGLQYASDLSQKLLLLLLVVLLVSLVKWVRARFRERTQATV